MQEEDDLARAIRLSEEEEARQKREREEASSKALFDESNDVDLFAQQQQPQMPMQTGWMQPQYTSYNVSR